jgi:hypothetical protein
MVIHMTALVILALLITPRAGHGNGVELVASFATDSDDSASNGRYDDDREEGGGSRELQASLTLDQSPSTLAAASNSLSALLNEAPPVDPSGVLPTGSGALGSAGLEQGNVGQALGFRVDGGSGQGRGNGRGSGQGNGPGLGRARTSIFGVPGEGSKFVYVFDRSGSTGGPGRSTLSAAKLQIIASLNDLDTVHQFQIIFYNESPSVFNPTGQPGKLVFANERNKLLAQRFVQSITSDGGTSHEEALLLAIRMQPEVIFFFTDADEPRLTARQLERIRRMANGIVINAIEFGIGPQADADDFMVKLARQNGGQFGYVDVTTLSSQR